MNACSSNKWLVSVIIGLGVYSCLLIGMADPCGKSTIHNAQCTGKGTVTVGSCTGRCDDGSCSGLQSQIQYDGCNECKGVPVDPENPKQCQAFMTPADCAEANCSCRIRTGRCGCPASGQGTCMVDPGAWGNWTGPHPAHSDCAP